MINLNCKRGDKCWCCIAILCGTCLANRRFLLSSIGCLINSRLTWKAVSNNNPSFVDLHQVNATSNVNTSQHNHLKRSKLTLDCLNYISKTEVGFFLADWIMPRQSFFYFVWNRAEKNLKISNLYIKVMQGRIFYA